MRALNIYLVIFFIAITKAANSSNWNAFNTRTIGYQSSSNIKDTDVFIDAGTFMTGYDYDGNLLTDGKNTYAYDYENRLISIKNDSGEIHYSYDALGRRISKSINEKEAFYSFDNLNLAEERNNDTTTNFVYGEGIDEILFKKDTLSHFFNTDELNSVQSITNGNGKIVENYNYDPFGKPHIFNSSNAELQFSTINNILFTARSFDFASNTYDYRFRQMDPSIGRFIQRDIFKKNANAYLYSLNDPINKFDPLGLDETFVHKGNKRLNKISGTLVQSYGSFQIRTYEGKCMYTFRDYRFTWRAYQYSKLDIYEIVHEDEPDVMLSGISIGASIVGLQAEEEGLVALEKASEAIEMGIHAYESGEAIEKILFEGKKYGANYLGVYYQITSGLVAHLDNEENYPRYDCTCKKAGQAETEEQFYPKGSPYFLPDSMNSFY